MEHQEIVAWLRETDISRLAHLWGDADRVRRRHVGDEVHLRGLIELSNHCARLCGYCGLRAPNTSLDRYRMSEEEILECAHKAVAFGYGTVVLQAGEDPGIRPPWIGKLVQRIQRETPLAVTLSLGEMDKAALAAWREAGADRYLLRFETSNQSLYQRIHPPKPGGAIDRWEILRTLKQLGYEVGTGVMIGIPGQTHDDLAHDITQLGRFEPDMIGCGPYLAHPKTPLGAPGRKLQPSRHDQVPGDELTTYKVIALSRLVCPKANIPSTTALATLNMATGREFGLARGANVVMPNLTPTKYRVLYEIYPNKACIRESADDCHRCLRRRIEAMGRAVGTGRGDSPGYLVRRLQSVEPS